MKTNCNAELSRSRLTGESQPHRMAHGFSALPWLLLCAPVWILGAGLAVAQPAVDAGPRVGRWGDFARLEFQGVTSFKTGEVVNGLLQAPAYRLVAHPAAPLQEFLPALRQSVSEGYRAAGFRDVRVRASLDEARERVVVEVTEGRRIVAGAVRVENPGPIPVAELVKRLTVTRAAAKPGSSGNGTSLLVDLMRGNEPLWKTGKPVGFDMVSACVRATAVKAVLGDCGFFFPRFHVDLRPEPGDERVSLVIAIEDVGPNGKVGPINVSGLVRHTATELLEWLGVKRGQPITADLVPRLERQMAESGRFLAQKVIPKQIPDEAGQVLLRVEVTEYTDSPPLGAPFSAAEQQFLQMRSWVESAFQRGEEFSIEVEAADFPLESIGLRITGQLEFILQRDGMALLQRVGGKLERGVVFASSGATYVSVVSGRRVSGLLFDDQRVMAALELRSEPDPVPADSPFFLRLLFGTDNRRKPGQSAGRIDFKIAPVAMIGEARKAAQTTRTEGEVIRFENDRRVWRMRRASGELVECSSTKKLPGGGFVKTSFRPNPGALARAERELTTAGTKLPNLVRPVQPLASIVGAAVAEFIEWPLTRQMFGSLPAREQIEPASRALQRLLLSGVLDAYEPDSSKSDGDGSFCVPDGAEIPLSTNPMQWVWRYSAALTFRFSQEHLPSASWPATLARETAMLLSGLPKYAEPELTRIFESPATGPVGHLAGAWLLARLGDRGASAQFAQRGLQRLNREDFQRDAALLLDVADDYLRKSRKPLETFTALAPEELAALAQLLPPSARGFLVRSVAALKLQPDKRLRAVLEPLLADWWRHGLEAELERALRAALTTATARSETDKSIEQAVACSEGHDALANLPEAARLFRRPAERGSVAAAQLKLGGTYSLGRDVPADYLAATFWYRVAEFGGDRSAGAMANPTARRLTAEQQVEIIRCITATFPNALIGAGAPRPIESPDRAVPIMSLSQASPPNQLH